MGEEWRRGWHPERVASKDSDAQLLVVGAGPAGLECALTLGRRGYRVHLAEAERELGGRVAAESRLPGLAAWARARDYRLQQLGKLTSVEIYRESRLAAEDVRELGLPHVVIATGARWRKDGIGRHNHKPILGWDGPAVFTPEDVMAGKVLDDPVVIFDDDDYYLGGVLAEKLRRAGRRVLVITPSPLVSAWTVFTLEQEKIQKRLIELGVEILANCNLRRIDTAEVELACMFTDRRTRHTAGTVVMVTARLPMDALYAELAADPGALGTAKIKTITRIGDCLASGMIAHAVYSGHRYAREFEASQAEGVPFRMEPVELSQKSAQ
jgi:dimethylamine/trimethylamine dehydrogenase